MPQTLGVTKAITNLNDAHRILQVRPTLDANFFPEWIGPFPELTVAEMEVCDRLRTRYQHYQAAGAITESTVNLMMIGPILEMLHLYDPPYLIKGEKYVKIEIEDRDQILEGLIDILVLEEQLWFIVLETKRYGFSVMQALPQTLTYMMANSDSKNSDSNNTLYGLITTGEDYLFVKLNHQRREYDLSDKMTLSTRRNNQFHTVIQILKHLIRTTVSPV
ncbi:MAG: type I restriction endonuclease subunit R [Leptolyngbyaceae bacterium]|nr:type I restriction endonuclease subunit R [Leptolyngbyaceae bacterium]